MEDEKNGFVTLHLLDAAQGHPVQTWKFQDCRQVIIGRSADADIVLTDPQVSRQHVQLTYGDGKWTLHSRGTNGTQIDGTSVTEICLTDQTVFSAGIEWALISVRQHHRFRLESGDDRRYRSHRAGFPLDR